MICLSFDLTRVCVNTYMKLAEVDTMWSQAAYPHVYSVQAVIDLGKALECGKGGKYCSAGKAF